MMRVTTATTFRASISSTSHITIVVLNIVDPFRTSIAFISEYLRHECSIRHCEECRRLKMKDKLDARFLDVVLAVHMIELEFDPGNGGAE